MTDESPPPQDPALPEVRPRGTRRRFAWRWTRRLLAVVTAVFAAVFVTFFSVDIGQFGQLKSIAEREGSKYLERPLTIGKLVAFVTPRRFAVEDVVIQGLKPTDRPFFRAKCITFEVSWWDLLWHRDLPLNVRLTGWDVFIESWGGGRHNLPKLKPKSSGGKRPFTITVDAEALNGAFAFEDHSTPWSVTAPNLTFAYRLAPDQRVRRHRGVLERLGPDPEVPAMSALTTRFILAGARRPDAHRSRDRRRPHARGGAVDFSLAEQRYDVSSSWISAHARALLRERAVGRRGRGEFAGIFHSTTAARSSPVISRAIARASKASSFRICTDRSGGCRTGSRSRTPTRTFTAATHGSPTRSSRSALPPAPRSASRPRSTTRASRRWRA